MGLCFRHFSEKTYKGRTSQHTKKQDLKSFYKEKSQLCLTGSFFVPIILDNILQLKEGGTRLCGTAS